MKKIIIMSLFVITFLSNICFIPAHAILDSGYGLAASTGSQPIVIDGSFQDWDQMPYSYEYNWNNPYQSTQWNPQTKRNETVTITDEKGQPYNTTIRHKMSLYRDDKFVYLHIIMAKNYYDSLNGYDYEFWCDGQEAAFQVELPGGGTITNRSFGSGIHKVEVRHGAGSISYSVANGSQAILKRNSGGINDELELKIPFSELQRQNRNIDPGNIRVLEFFSHNLMYRHIVCAGTDTGPYVGIAVCFILAGGGCVLYIKKKRKVA